MRALSLVVKTLCLIPLATGGLDLLLGAKALGATGAHLPVDALSDPTLNSQLRFFGAIWLGFGVMLWCTTTDLKANAAWFQLLCGVLVLSGVGRVISLVQFGLPAPAFVGAIVVELVLIPLVLLWHRHELKLGHKPPVM
jgi:hypothetical protein